MSCDTLTATQLHMSSAGYLRLPSVAAFQTCWMLLEYLLKLGVIFEAKPTNWIDALLPDPMRFLVKWSCISDDVFTSRDALTLCVYSMKPMLASALMLADHSRPVLPKYFHF
mmetsp:Transcript_13997/g.16943  ORF Transcript_13997/g.16943 Transcript_13997/m.16943 type:complete len:112 (-) Transcript_13997:1454-1789(-)